MRVLEDSIDRLVIDMAPRAHWLKFTSISLFLIALGLMTAPITMGIVGAETPRKAVSLICFFIVFSLTLAVIMFKRRKLNFDAKSGLITIETKGIFARIGHEYPLKAFFGAKLAQTFGHPKFLGKIVLAFSDQNGAVPVPMFCAQNVSSLLLAAKINKWLKTMRGVKRGPGGVLMTAIPDFDKANIQLHQH